MNNWLLADSILLEFANAPKGTPQEIEAVTLAMGGGGVGNPDRVMTITGDVATVNIQGVMTSRPSFLAYYFGGGNTLFGDLISAIQVADADPNVKRIDLAIASGGGEAQPTIALGDAIAAAKTPTRALVTTAASAAYWAASQADTIVAVNRASQVGSIGAVRQIPKPSKSFAVEVTSTNAPNKRPDPETPEGKDAIRAELDEFGDLFATAVAVGRDKSVETVNNEFGRGGMMLAARAKSVGMIDSIGDDTTAQAPTVTKTEATTPTGATIMDLATLEKEHPALLAQIQADARKDGAAAELDRVAFHLSMGKTTGAMDIATQACLDGSAKDNGTLQAAYMSAGMNKSNLDDRQKDEAILADNTPAADDEASKDKAFAAAVFSGLLDEQEG